MIKLPKEVNRIMKAIEGAGFDAFAVGLCVRDSLLGETPFDWDIVTPARLEVLQQLFPNGKIISEKNEIVRVEEIQEVFDKDGTFLGEEGYIIDISPYRKESGVFTAEIEEDLSRRDFTINAIADSPYRTVDPYNGREDLKSRLIRTVGEPIDKFKKKPIRMLSAIRLAAELGFDLHKSVYEAIVNHYELLESEEIGKIRGEFSKIISSSHAGKGLSMIMDTGILNVILGKDVVPKLTRREMSDLTVLCQNIDKTHRVKDRRLGLFYTCMDKKKALSSIEKLGFDGDTYQHLVDAACDMAKLYFLAQKPNLKKFIYERGWDRYNYMASLEKAQRIVFDYYSDTKIKSRMFMLDEIKAYKEPIFTEDMVIDGNDLLEAGICNEEQVEKLLAMMVEELHVHPKLNTRKDLLKLAKKYKNNKMAAMTRGIHWLR